MAELNASKASISQAELDSSNPAASPPRSPAGSARRESDRRQISISSTQSNTPPLTTIASVDPIHVLFDVD
jgi:hypothetical protein